MIHCSKFLKPAVFAAGSFALLLPIVPAQAQTAIVFDGLVLQSCVLAVSTPGQLGLNTSSGTEMSSELTGGVAATMTVVATAGAPTIAFTANHEHQARRLFRDADIVAQVQLAGGANQAYTSSASEYTSTNTLTDTVTLHAKATDSSGFAAGNYRIQTTATCEQ